MLGSPKRALHLASEAIPKPTDKAMKSTPQQPAGSPLAPACLRSFPLPGGLRRTAMAAKGVLDAPRVHVYIYIYICVCVCVCVSLYKNMYMKVLLSWFFRGFEYFKSNPNPNLQPAKPSPFLLLLPSSEPSNARTLKRCRGQTLGHAAATERLGYGPSGSVAPSAPKRRDVLLGPTKGAIVVGHCKE